MAFKQFSNYLEQKNGEFFTLRDDGDYADVVFLYTKYEDMMVCDTHYLSTTNYHGYVQCCMEDHGSCPACSYGDNGIRKQTSLFIPLYNLSKNRLEFWDRTSSFEYVINTSVFKNYPNPSEYVFRITRRGQYRDPKTRYEITVQGRNAGYPYAQIIADHDISFPEGYSRICKEMSPQEMAQCLNNNGPASNIGDYSYVPKPRESVNSTSIEDTVPEPPEIDVPTDTFSAPPTDLPTYETASVEPEEIGTDTVTANEDMPEYDPTSAWTDIPSAAESDSDNDNSIDDIDF